MTQSTIALTLGNITIRQHNGLFSLNDLHKASGGEENFKPAFFLRNDQAKALIAEIAKGADLHLFLNTTKGRNGSTYACRELVIAYAAWISAAFHLKVIRVFLAVAAPQATPYTVQPGDTLNEAQQIALRTLLESNVKRLPQEKQAAAMVGGWSKLKAHFGVPYRQIPASEFTEALSIIARHVSQWEVLDAPQQTQPAIDPSTPRPWPPPASRPTNTLTRPAKANTCSSPPPSPPKCCAACWPSGLQRKTIAASDYPVSSNTTFY